MIEVVFIIGCGLACWVVVVMGLVGLVGRA